MERVPVTETSSQETLPVSRDVPRSDIGQTRDVSQGVRTEETHPFGERRDIGGTSESRSGQPLTQQLGEKLSGDRPITEKIREGFETVKGRVMESPRTRRIYDKFGHYGRKIKETTHPFCESSKKKIGQVFDENDSTISKLSNLGTILGGTMIVLGSLLTLSSGAIMLGKWGWNYYKNKGNKDLEKGEENRPYENDPNLQSDVNRDVRERENRDQPNQQFK